MKNIKVLQVKVDDKNNGGVFSLVKEAYYHMSENIIFDFWSVEPIQNMEFRNYVEKRGGKIFCYYKRNKYIRGILSYFDLKKRIKETNYDVVHIHTDKTIQLYVYALAAKKCKGRTIVHAHNMGVDRMKNRTLFEMIEKVARKLILHAGVDIFAACSINAAKAMYPKKILNKVSIINNGIDTKKFQYNGMCREGIRKKYGLGEYFVIGHVGKFTYAKNHMFILRIFREIRKKYNNVKFIMIGDGIQDLREKIITLAKKEDIYKDILFIKATNEVEKYMSAMDLFILPSIIEGLPLVCVEAQASGLPCMISSCVPKEAKILDSFSRLSISNLEDWVIQIGEYIENRKTVKRENCWIDVKEAGYDVNHTVYQLMQLYS